MVWCGVNEFLDVGLSLEEIIDATLLWFGSGTAYVLDDVAFQESEVLINNEVPDWDTPLLIMRW